MTSAVFDRGQRVLKLEAVQRANPNEDPRRRFAECRALGPSIDPPLCAATW